MKTYVLQIIATKSKDEAVRVFESLKKKNLPVRIDKVNDWYKVRIGNFKSYEEAKKFVLKHNLEGKGYISLINYEPRRTVLASNLEKKNLEKKKKLIQTIDNITSESFDKVSNSKETSLKKENSYQSTNYTTLIKKVDYLGNLKAINRESQNKEEKSNGTLHIHKITNLNTKKEGRMNFEVIAVLLVFLIVFLIIIRYLIKKLREKTHIEDETVSHQMEDESIENSEENEKYDEIELKNLETEDSREIQETLQIKNPVEEEKFQETKFTHEKGGILVSYGKLVIGESTSITGDVVSKDSVIVENNSRITGSITAEKYVKLEKNVKTGKILAPIVHTIRDEELPKIPETEVPVSGGLKSNGDLELSDGLLIQGSVEVGGNLKIGKNSKILGNVSAKNVVVDEGTFIYGKISSLQDVEIRNRVIVGSGPGKGGIKAGGRVKLGSSVVILGNIDAKEIVAE
ncbi:Polymer-forming protein [Balnearium lithotrophicum]|uniref:Polymer-forming protein n=1 Tax=Balnearium lithotrophicum TaxID=223788 RepID=A0A521D6N5_9BACT|nr:SPOR domain-containing protein [Balnearium lithotrophicum]SMO67285.1 Polymer-forming protein [Balnearium lithotrophicum]